MGGLNQLSPAREASESIWRPVLIGVVIVVIVVGALVLALRQQPKLPSPAPAYAANLKFSDFKMSAAENFVGSTVNYIDGTVSNQGNKTVTHAVIRVIFKDDLGQVVGNESLPLHVLQGGGLYPDYVDLMAAPLGPGQTKQFRLTFESISAQWNHQYPEMQLTSVATQ